MFVRAKSIKGQKYGYLVKNSWVKGKVKQKTKKYLGKIIPITPEVDIQYDIDFSQSKRQVLRDIIGSVLIASGFKKKGLLYYNENITVHVGTAKILAGKASCVLQLHDRYVYSGLLKQFLDYYEPEDDTERPGTRLAKLLSDIGINIPPKIFIQLYKKIYTNVSLDN